MQNSFSKIFSFNFLFLYMLWIYGILSRLSCIGSFTAFSAKLSKEEQFYLSGKWAWREFCQNLGVPLLNCCLIMDSWGMLSYPQSSTLPLHPPNWQPNYIFRNIFFPFILTRQVSKQKYVIGLRNLKASICRPG